MTSRVRQQRHPQLLLMNLHLLANPGDSLLLQHTLDRLLRWLCPSLRIFHVSERAAPFRSYTRLCPVAGKDHYRVVLHLLYICFVIELDFRYLMGRMKNTVVRLQPFCTFCRCIFLPKEENNNFHM